VLRRNPDIKILRQSDDVDGFARQQLAILQGLWPALAVDGRLLYVTCSLLQAENDDVIARFTASNGGAVVEPLQLSEGLARQYGWQTLPDPKGGDGLYFSLLRKAAG
jgi:16S rRNA (cytosine967-C5)-methyltransferase